MRLCSPAGIVIGAFSIWFIALGPLKPYYKSTIARADPQIILVLGGDIEREHVGLRLANELDLPLVLSGGSNPEHANWLVEKSGIPKSLVDLDYRASDTLENFTSLVDGWVERGINHVILITSQDHFARAINVGGLIAGSRGIRLSGVAVDCYPLCKQESLKKFVIDSIRASLWVVTGKDLKSYINMDILQNFPLRFN